MVRRHELADLVTSSRNCFWSTPWIGYRPFSQRHGAFAVSIGAFEVIWRILSTAFLAKMLEFAPIETRQRLQV